jgi:hypothetical protein
LSSVTTSQQPDRVGGDEALEALDALVRTIGEVRDLLDRAGIQASRVTRRRRNGETWRDLVPSEPRPLVVEMLTRAQERLTSAGSQWRRAQAKALYEEGLTTQGIADLFGVTRQRISALLGGMPSSIRGRRRRQQAAPAGDGWAETGRTG